MIGALLAALLPLFENGTTRWKVVVAPEADPCVRFAAQEFTNALERVSGARFEIVAAADASSPAVIIANRGDTWDEEVVEYRLEDGNLLLTGNQPRAALHATYSFLQRELGVRWLWPDADGEVFPKRRRWEFPGNFGFRHVPSVKYRGFHHCGAWRNRDAFNLWQTRNFSTIHRHSVYKGEEKYGQYSMYSTHSANLGNDKALFAEHPECFAVIDGRRSLLNICFSSALAAEKVAARIESDIGGPRKARVPDILSIYPADSVDYCQCETCRKLGVSTAWFSFYNRLVAILRPRHPKMRFATLAYQGYLDPPACRIEDTDFVEYASHPRCHIHRWKDPTCAANASEMRRISNWLSRDDVGLGHYAYEYDAVTRHGHFMPFFSMIADVVDTAVEQKLVTCIPEVGLSPEKGPDDRCSAVQNRLTLLLYAWKSWDAALTTDRFFDDVTCAAYGPAAAPLGEYLRLMDDAWNKLPGKIGLFADGINVSADLLAEEATRNRAAALLGEAERLARAGGTERELRNVLREKALYGQICENLSFKLGLSQTVNLPHLGKGAVPTASCTPGIALQTADGKPGRVRVRGAWTDDELVFAWTGAASASLELSVDGARYQFGVKGGRTASRMISDVGVESMTWKPVWTVEKASGALVFRLPANLFGRPPNANEQWDVRFAAGQEAFPSRKDMTVKMGFRAASAADRPLVYYLGERKGLDYRRKQLPGLRAEGESCGWRVTVCTNRAELARAASTADTFYLEVPDAKCIAPETAAVIREKVRAGGTFLCGGWTEMPLDRFLGDPALKCHYAAAQDLSLGSRKAKFVREGDWCRRPWNVEWHVRNGYTPCYLMQFDVPGAVEYATMPTARDPLQTAPFISALRYGKGVIILVGEDLRISHYKLIDNIRADLGLH